MQCANREAYCLERASPKLYEYIIFALGPLNNYLLHIIFILVTIISHSSFVEFSSRSSLCLHSARVLPTSHQLCLLVQPLFTPFYRFVAFSRPRDCATLIWAAQKAMLVQIRFTASSRMPECQKYEIILIQSVLFV